MNCVMQTNICGNLHTAPYRILVFDWTSNGPQQCTSNACLSLSLFSFRFACAVIKVPAAYNTQPKQSKLKRREWKKRSTVRHHIKEVVISVAWVSGCEWNRLIDLSHRDWYYHSFIHLCNDHIDARFFFSLCHSHLHCMRTSFIFFFFKMLFSFVSRMKRKKVRRHCTWLYSKTWNFRRIFRKRRRDRVVRKREKKIIRITHAILLSHLRCCTHAFVCMENIVC